MKSQLSQKGKISFSTILIMLLLFYGAFAAFKIISSRLTKSQIKNEIVDKFGYIRGPDFTVEKGEKIIQDILKEHELYTEPGEEDEYEDESGEEEGSAESEKAFTGTRISVTVLQKGAKIKFYVEYMDIIDLILFKTKAYYTIDDEMLNYN